MERAFDTSCDRWRTLYRAALAQRVTQNKIIGDASRSQRDKDQARRLRREAEAQLDLLISEPSASSRRPERAPTSSTTATTAPPST